MQDRGNSTFLLITQEVVDRNYDFFDVGCFTSNNPFDFDGDPDYDLDPEII